MTTTTHHATRCCYHLPTAIPLLLMILLVMSTIENTVVVAWSTASSSPIKSLLLLRRVQRNHQPPMMMIMAPTGRSPGRIWNVLTHKQQEQSQRHQQQQQQGRLFYRNRPADEESLTDTKTSANASSLVTTTTTVSSSSPNLDPTEQQQQDEWSTSAATTTTLALNRRMLRTLELSQIITVLVAFVAALLIRQTGGAAGAVDTQHLTSDTGRMIASLLDWHAPLSSSASALHVPISPVAATTTTISLMELVWQGVVGAMPMIALSRWMEQSSHRDACHVSFSTTNMVVTLFGKRRSSVESSSPTSETTTSQTPPAASTSTQAMLRAASRLCLVTAVSEEVLFRGVLPATLYTLTHSIPVAAMGQALLFGLGHAHLQADRGENRLVLSLQMMNGLWYAWLYQQAGTAVAAVAATTAGPALLALIPCITAHFLYDMHILTATWHGVNNQLDYTAQQTALAASSSSLEGQSSKKPQSQQQQRQDQEVWNLQQASGNALTNETIALCRRFFFAFDSQHQSALSLPDVQRAVSYAFLSDSSSHHSNGNKKNAIKIVPPPSDQVEHAFAEMIAKRRSLASRDGNDDRPVDRLEFPDFLRLLFTLRAQAYANAIAQQQRPPLTPHSTQHG